MLKRVIPLVLVVALLIGGLWYVRRTDQTDQRNMRKLYTLVEPLQREKEALMAEKDSLEIEYGTLLRDISTVQLMFREMDARIFTDVYPLMRDRGITGVLGISLHEYPEYKKTMLRREEFDRLLMDGWGLCYMYESDYKLDSWLRHMHDKFNKDGIAAPTSIYFPDNTYVPEMDEILLADGITTVVLGAEDGHSATVTPIESLWFTGAMPWNYTGVTSDTELLGLTIGGNLCFTISFNSLWDAFEQESLVRILDTWESYQVVESPLTTELLPTPTPTPTPSSALNMETYDYQLKIMSFEKARAAHLEAAESRDSLVREKTNRQNELDAQINDLTDRIEAIYADWSK